MIDVVGVTVAVRVADGVAAGVGVAPLSTVTAIVLLHTDPGFFTQNVADEAGPWYPVATIFPDRTETVLSWMYGYIPYLSITVAPVLKPEPRRVTVIVPVGSGLGDTDVILGP